MVLFLTHEDIFFFIFFIQFHLIPIIIIIMLTAVKIKLFQEREIKKNEEMNELKRKWTQNGVSEGEKESKM